MAVLLDLIDQVSDVKQDIKTAINAKGVEVTDETPFTDYASKIGDIQASANPQDKTVFSGGVVEYDSGTKTYLGYSTALLPANGWHAKGETVWAASDAKAGDVAYDSTDLTGSAPDLSKPISSIVNVYSGSMYLKIHGLIGYSVNRDDSKEYEVTSSYDSLGNVTVDSISMKAVGAGAGDTVHVETNYVTQYAFYNAPISDLTCDATIIDSNAFFGLSNAHTATFTNYKGVTDYVVNTETGEIDFNTYESNDSKSVISGAFGLQYLNIPEVVIMEGGFASDSAPGDWDAGLVLSLNAPKLEGILSGTALGRAYSSRADLHMYSILKNSDIDFTEFKYIGKEFGQVLEEYLGDNTGTITNVLSFPNLEYIGPEISGGQDTGTTYRQNITQILTPKLKCIKDQAAITLPLISWDLPDIEYIGNSVFAPLQTSTIQTIDIGSKVKTIKSTAFDRVDGVTINIDLPAPDAGDTSWKANAPWGATNATVNWTGIVQ